MTRLQLTLILGMIGFAIQVPQLAQAQFPPDKRLVQKISVDVQDHSVVELLRELGEKHKLPVDIHPSIAEEGLEGEKSFSLSAEGLMLGSVIQLACDSLDLVWRIEKGRLQVLTKIADSAILTVREYPMLALGPNSDPQSMAFNLTFLTSGPWMDVDGEGGAIVAITPRSYTIRQSSVVHQQLQTLFDQLAAATGRARGPSVQERADQFVLRKLQTPALFESEQTELPQLVDQLLKKSGVPYWVDVMSLTEEGIDWTKLNSTVDAKKMSVAARLDAIATEHQLSWRVGSEVVQFTTAAKAKDLMTTRVYDVRRLIGPNRTSELIAEQLTSNMDLGPWLDSDGEGGVAVSAGPFVLVRHNAQVLAKIAKLMN